jgi:hypothetical protein
MICKGLEKGKFSPEEAMQKLEEFVDLDLIDEDHQEILESLIAEAQDEEYYWASAKKDAAKDYDDQYDYYNVEEEFEEPKDYDESENDE